MRIIRVCGVDIKVNLLLCILFFFLFFFGYIENVIISFIVVLIHEGAHTVVAKLLNYNTESIELFPFGGVARIEESIAINPQHEIMIALAGPLINFSIVLIGHQLSRLVHSFDEIFIFFIYANLIIGFFNLIPMLPLDGGRIIRAYLAFLIGVKRSTKLVVRLSKIMSAIIFAWGCFIIQYNKINILIPLLVIFLFIAAHREHQMAVFIFMKEITQKKQYLLAQGILSTKNLVAIKSASVKEIINQFVPRKYHIITVMDKKCNVIGIITESEILDGMIKYGLNVTLEKLLMSK